MANDIKTTTTADITFSPSEGESLADYLACLRDSLSTLPCNPEFKKLLSAGGDMRLVINGISNASKEVSSEAVEEEDFDLEEFLDKKVTQFCAENPELMIQLGTDVMRDMIYDFFEQLTGVPIRDDDAEEEDEEALSEFAQALLKELK